jgi:hypothetical protein
MKITVEQISGLERILLVAVFIMLVLVLVFVSIQAYELIDLADGFKNSKLAYDSAVVNTFVEPFNKIIGAFIVYAFGKLGVKLTDNYIRLKLAGNNDVELNRISIFG